MSNKNRDLLRKVEDFLGCARFPEGVWTLQTSRASQQLSCPSMGFQAVPSCDVRHSSCGPHSSHRPQDGTLQHHRIASNQVSYTCSPVMAPYPDILSITLQPPGMDFPLPSLKINLLPPSGVGSTGS